MSFAGAFMLLTTLGAVLLLPFGTAFLLCDKTVAPERVQGEEYVWMHVVQDLCFVLFAGRAGCITEPSINDTNEFHSSGAPERKHAS
jgi:hypothetical protein